MQLNLLHSQNTDVILTSSLIPQLFLSVNPIPDQLNQYYELLEDIGRDKIEKNFSVSENERVLNQQHGKIIIALMDGKVVGGARLIISKPQKRCILPLEFQYNYLNELFPELQLYRTSYCEWGRFVINPDLNQKSVIAQQIAFMCVNVAVKEGCRYLFGLPISNMKQRYEQFFKLMNLEFRELISWDKLNKTDKFKNKHYIAFAHLYNYTLPSFI